MDPNLQRLGNREITVTGSHQLTSRVSVTAGWYHRTYQDLQQLDRTLITTSDYTSFTIPTPDVSRDATLDGVIPQRPADGLQPQRRETLGLQFSSSRQERRRSVDLQRRSISRSTHGCRPAARCSAAGRWSGTCRCSVRATTTRTDRRLPISTPACRWPTAAASAIRGNSTCRSSTSSSWQAAIPVPVVGVDVSVVVQSYAGLARTITYQPPANLFPGGRTNTETIILNEPGSSVLPSLQSARSEFQEELQDRNEDVQRADRLLQRAERKRDLCATGRRRQFTRRRHDDPPGTTDHGWRFR